MARQSFFACKIISPVAHQLQLRKEQPRSFQKQKGNLILYLTNLHVSSLLLPFLLLFSLPRPKGLPDPDYNVFEELTQPAWSCQPFQ